MRVERAGPTWGMAWGKFSPALGHHHLAHHCADVAAVFKLLLSREPYRSRAEAALGRRLECGEIGCLTALAFLHDIGKLSPGFQARIWPAQGQLTMIGHLDAGWLWPEAPVEEQSGADWHHVLGAWPELELWFTLILSHHGRPTKRPGQGKVSAAFAKSMGYDWQHEHRQIGAVFRIWFPGLETSAPPTAVPAFLHFTCGLLTLADWVASDSRAFPFEARLRDDYWQTALERAETRIAEIGLAAGGLALSGPPDWALISDHPEPRPAQKAIGDLTTTERLVLLESETGSGKTEAALWRFAALLAAGEVEAMYFAVPTRAAARQLQRRLNAALARMCDPVPEALLAIPGQALVGETRGRRLPDFSVLWEDGEARPTRWAAEHSARYLAAPIAIGTVDQIALGGLQVKYAHLRGTALSRALLVIDEVHASDPYMTEVQRRMVRDHLHLGGHALLMSATLGAAARCRWFGNSVAGLAEEASRPYPAVWTTASIQSVDREASANKTVGMEAHAGWTGAEAADLALAAARQGARVLVIRNTVLRAQETFAAVRAAAPELLLQVMGIPTLHHSRFASEDRGLLDIAVEDALGSRQGPKNGCIVIGSQTLEQSLDIDADFLITDLCPMDVLLQRIGRLHRHPTPRPTGFEAPRTVVLCPPGDLDPLVQRAENGLGANPAGPSLSGIYVDVPGLAATLDEIVQKPVWRIPDMNRELVEAATHPEPLARIAEARGWQSYHQRLRGKVLAEMGAAHLVVLDRGGPLQPFPDDERIRTRLGEEGVVLTLPAGTTGAFGLPVHSLTLPAHWSKGLTGDEAVEVLSREPLRIGVGGQVFSYGAEGLTRDA